VIPRTPFAQAAAGEDVAALEAELAAQLALGSSVTPVRTEGADLVLGALHHVDRDDDLGLLAVDGGVAALDAHLHVAVVLIEAPVLHPPRHRAAPAAGGGHRPHHGALFQDNGLRADCASSAATPPSTARKAQVIITIDVVEGSSTRSAPSS